MSLVNAPCASDTDVMAKISELARQESGLVINSEKALMVKSRLKPRIKQLGLSSLEEYQEFVCSEKGREERGRFVSALTTNVSFFFREPHHFDSLVAMVNKKVLKGSSGKKIRIWSAACSNGQEPYSIAMSLLSNRKESWPNDMRVLATDIDTKVLSFAKSGLYTSKMLEEIDEAARKLYFVKAGPEHQNKEAIKDCVKNLTTFKKLNLLKNWPMSRRFDAIFCRNVVIYFDSSTREALWSKFANQLTEGGLFFLGHSERIPEPERYGFENVGPTTYRRISKHTTTVDI